MRTATVQAPHHTAFSIRPAKKEYRYRRFYRTCRANENTRPCLSLLQLRFRGQVAHSSTCALLAVRPRNSSPSVVLMTTTPAGRRAIASRNPSLDICRSLTARLAAGTPKVKSGPAWRRRSQVVRQRSAKPPSPVRFWASPPIHDCSKSTDDLDGRGCPVTGVRGRTPPTLPAAMTRRRHPSPTKE